MPKIGKIRKESLPKQGGTAKEPNHLDLTDSDYHVLQQFENDLNDARENGIPASSIRAQYCDLYSAFPNLCKAFHLNDCLVRRLARGLSKFGEIVLV